MIKKVLIVLALVLVLTPAMAQLTESDTKTQVLLDEPISTYDYGFNSVSVLTGNASTTVQTVTALANRRVIEFRVLDASKEIHVALGSTTVDVDDTHAVVPRAPYGCTPSRTRVHSHRRGSARGW